MKKRLLACFLAAVMALQVSGLTALAEQPVSEQPTANEENNTEQNTSEESDGSVFNFSAARYVLSETDKSYEVMVERTGSSDAASDVVFKAVDALAVYGEDYTVLDEDGNALEKKEGTVISPEELTKLTSAQNEGTEDFEKLDAPKNDVFEARNALLGIDTENLEEEEQVKDEVTTAVETLNNDLFDAEGVSGVVHFAEGESEKTITVVPIDNDKGEADKTAVMALLGASDGSIAPNATAALVIMDDEEYVPPVFEMAQDSITLDVQNSTAELTIRRTSSEDYYTTVYASTYSMTAKSGEDFTAVENQQIVFAPGETEKTVRVEALAFDRNGDFGVRIKSDGSCEIGENDRTVVHIEGEKSVSESVSAQADEAENSVALQSAGAVSPASDETASEDEGAAGAPTYWVSERPYIIRDNNNGTSYHVGSSIYVNGNSSITVDWQSLYKSNAESVTLEIVSGSPVRFRVSNSLSYMDIKTGYYQQPTQVTIPISELYYNHREQLILTGFDNNTYIIIKRLGLNFAKKDIQLASIEKVETQPIIDLDSDWKGEQVVNYQPPAPKLKTESGADLKAIYPNDEKSGWCYRDRKMLGGKGYFTVDADEDLMKHGVWLTDKSGTDYYNGAAISVQSVYSYLSWLTDEEGRLVLKPSYNTVNVHLESTDGGDTYINIKNEDYKKPFEAKTGTILRGHGYVAAGKVITGYDIYAGKADDKGNITEKKFLYTYVNPKDSSLLGGYSPEEWFYVPADQERYWNNRWKEVIIVPHTEIQNLVVKPHPSTKNETIYEDVYDDNGNVTGQREVTYEGRAYLNRTFDDNAGEDDTYVADKNGQVAFEKINSGSVFTLRSVSPMGYLTEWVNGTMDKDGDGVIDNAQASGMSQAEVDNLYIGNYAFKNCSSLTSLDIPSGVRTIGLGAFEGCTNLKTATLPFIGSQVGDVNTKNTFSYIFNGKVPQSLKVVSITNDTAVPESAFEGCSYIEKIYLNEGVLTIGSKAFKDCTRLLEFKLPKGITEIGSYTFQNCSSIEVMELSDTITAIGAGAFEGCLKIEKLYIPQVSAINNYTFRNCTSLTEIDIPNSVKTVGEKVLEGCTSLVDTVAKKILVRTSIITDILLICSSISLSLKCLSVFSPASFFIIFCCSLNCPLICLIVG